MKIKCGEHWQTAFHHQGFIILREPLKRAVNSFIPRYSNSELDIYYSPNIKQFMTYHDLRDAEVSYEPLENMADIVRAVEHIEYVPFLAKCKYCKPKGEVGSIRHVE